MLNSKENNTISYSDFPTIQQKHTPPAQYHYDYAPNISTNQLPQYFQYYDPISQQYYYQQYYPQCTYFQQETQQKLPKLSRNQKRKQKLKQKKQQLQNKEGKEKQFIQQISKPEEQQNKIIQKRKTKLSHLIEIGKEVYKLRKKMGLLRAETTKAKVAKSLGIVHKKKPSMIKRVNQKYQQMNKKNSLKPIKQDEQWENQIQEANQNVETIQYPPSGKLLGTLFNNIQLRQWVDHVPSQALQEKVLIFINKLAHQQAIKKIKQPLKWKKRVVAGFNQCMRTVRIKQQNKKSKCLFIALNIIKNPLKLAADDRILEIIQSAKQQNIPIIHVSTRSKLGRSFLGKFGSRLSVVSIINYEASQESFQQIIEQWKKLQQQYVNIN